MLKKKTRKNIICVLSVFLLFMISGNVSVFASDNSLISKSESNDEQMAASKLTENTESNDKNNPMDLFIKSYSAGTMEELFSKDSSGNVHVIAAKDEIKAEKDFYWAGDSIDAKLIHVGYDLLMAGMDIDISGGTVNGALRAAGNSVQFSDMKIGRNVTVAGKIVRLMNVSFDTGYLAGEKVTFQGKADCIHAAGTTVVINGIVNGDVSVRAQKVIIGPKAVIKGTLKGSAADIQKSEQGKINDDELKESSADKDEQNSFLGNAAGGASFLTFGFNMVLWLLVCICLRKPVEGAGKIMKKRPGSLAITGGICIFAIPLASIVLFMTIVGIPVALIAFMIYLIMWMIAIPFAGAVVGRLILPAGNRWLSSLLGVIILSVLSVLPLIGNIISIAAGMFTIGYFAKLFFEKCIKKDDNKYNSLYNSGDNGNGADNEDSSLSSNGYDYNDRM